MEKLCSNTINLKFRDIHIRKFRNYKLDKKINKQLVKKAIERMKMGYTKYTSKVRLERLIKQKLVS